MSEKCDNMSLKDVWNFSHARIAKFACQRFSASLLYEIHQTSGNGQQACLLGVRSKVTGG